MYFKLDLDDFFKDEYKSLNYSEGIGAMGIITSRQIINVYNDYGLNKKDNLEYLGLENHMEMTSRILFDIYRSHNIDRLLYEVISIKYWNSPYYKLILFFLPELLTLKEFNNLETLDSFYNDIFKKYQISIGCYTFGDNIREYRPAIECISDFNPILDYASKRVDKTLVRKREEKILKI
ncbi:MAG: hypothetical protein J6G98_03910 [Bacilli bacterium]|nr:hypothetical protein [Bacilli bacterium]